MGRPGDGNTQQDSEPEQMEEQSLELPEHSSEEKKSAGTQSLPGAQQTSARTQIRTQMPELPDSPQKKKRDGRPQDREEKKESAREQPAQHHLIRWTVPLEEFQVDDRDRYVAKTPLLSPVMTTVMRASGGCLSLDWQLCLRQHRTEAKLELHHKTPDIPNQGVHYVVWAAKVKGRGRVRLNTALRRALATYRPDVKGKAKPKVKESAKTKEAQRKLARSLKEQARTALAERVVRSDGTVKLEVVVKMTGARWAPVAVVEAQIREERERCVDETGGNVGLGLWTQVCRGTAANPPAEADLSFLCPNNQQVFAHKTVVAASCPAFAASLQGSRKGLWRISCEEVSAQAMWEVLHFVYVRKVSPSLYRAPLVQVLEAGRLFGEPRLLWLETERLLLFLLNGLPVGRSQAQEELLRLFTLAHVYRLPVLLNAAHTRAQLDFASLVPVLQQTRDRLRASSLRRALPGPVTDPKHKPV